jgi:hypothetical protein
MAGEFPKQPSEAFTIAADFVNELATAETISSKTVTATLDGVDATSTVIASSSISSSQVLVFVQAGESGRSYLIKVKITTSASNTYELNIYMNVREDTND